MVHRRGGEDGEEWLEEVNWGGGRGVDDFHSPSCMCQGVFLSDVNNTGRMERTHYRGPPPGRYT